MQQNRAVASSDGISSHGSTKSSSDHQVMRGRRDTTGSVTLHITRTGVSLDHFRSRFINRFINTKILRLPGCNRCSPAFVAVREHDATSDIERAPDGRYVHVSPRSRQLASISTAIHLICWVGEQGQPPAKSLTQLDDCLRL
jgi:hypothetical protein